MTLIEFEIKGRKRQKNFKNTAHAHKFLFAKGYEFDDIHDYYWKVDVLLGWITTAKIIEAQN